jgi:dihydroneopterin aldolase
MGTIKLKNIRTVFHHVVDWRGKIGSDYSIDLEIKTDLRKSCTSDDLNESIMFY